MRPGQINPTELEAAILERIAKTHPGLDLLIQQLHVLSREFTGVGSYTEFAPCNPSSSLQNGYLVLGELVEVPGVSNGLGAALACEAGCLQSLEIYTFGNELWDGNSSDFTIGDSL